MVTIGELEPELREAVENYRRYGLEMSEYDQKVYKYDRDEDVARLREATAQRNYWEGRIKELIKGREKELYWVLIG
ncbi:MAG TPA: hypothetical protein VLT35_01875 [Methanocella sp.]|nr:hypothetical protein [Methanocella sp.]